MNADGPQPTKYQLACAAVLVWDLISPGQGSRSDLSPEAAVKHDTATALSHQYRVARTYIVQARYLQKTNPELFREVQEGVISLPTAYGRSRTKEPVQIGLGVYFIGPGPSLGPTKIGWTGNLYGRLTSFQTGHWAKLSILLWLPTDDPVGLEDELHKKFDHRWITGEWFDLTAFDLDAVSSSRAL